jgi:type IV secretory pathway TraG/TraD family ATPase VirD4
LSEIATYESALVQGGMGKGKTSVFVIPNLLNPSRLEPSFVVTDTSGEIHRHTSGYLERRGYQIRVLDLMDVNHSETYNPLANATSPERIGELAQTLISSSSDRTGANGSSSDPFWNQAAEKLIRIMAQCLMNQPDPHYRTLANVRHLITSFDAHIAPKGQLGKIDQFVLNTTQNDPVTYNSYRSFVAGNLKTIQSILMSADVVLDPLALPDMARVTSSSSFKFEDLRQQKTIIYIRVNQTKMTLYSFLLNLFYSDLFKSLLQNEQDPGRPVWLFLDEFGHLKIPDFHIYATTARKYKVAFALFLQSMSQLEGRYGRFDAQTIQEALGSEIYLPGMALDNARAVEARLGQVAARNHSHKPLMAASDIIRMKDNNALLLHSNKLPVRLKTQRYFDNRILSARSKIPAVIGRNSPARTVPLIQL